MIRIRGRALPDGEPIELCADGDRWRADPPAAAGDDTLVRGWILPGLVDAHTHPGCEHPSDGLSEEILRADLERHVDAGVTLIRSPGLAGEPPEWFGTDQDLPRAVHAGPWLAREGAFFDGAGRRVELADLPGVAAAQAARGGWAKLIGDWPGTDPLPAEVVARVVAAVHAVGGRVAMHCQDPESCRTAVLSGVDTVEHGQHLADDLVQEMARRGTVWTPTLRVILAAVPDVRRREPSARRDAFVAGALAMPDLVAAAAEAGVPLLAGTDSRPHGRIVDEVTELIAAGVPTATAIGAASWQARAYLGLPGLVDGALADAVVYAEDPRAVPGVLAHPEWVILRGRVLRGRC